MCDLTGTIPGLKYWYQFSAVLITRNVPVPKYSSGWGDWCMLAFLPLRGLGTLSGVPVSPC